MSADEPNGESFEDALRSIAREVGEYIERSIERVDLDELANATGVDPSAARDWIDSTASWLRMQTENLGQQLASRVGGSPRVPVRVDPLNAAAPHPLDLPSDEQGLALAALDSGRWTVEPGADTLGARDEGPGPMDALGIVRELRVRDWIGADGKLTLVGRHALGRWLDATASR
jgi:hypothetical protein